MSNPTNLLYSKSHEWVRVENDEVVIGITHFAQEALGDITYVELPAQGAIITADAEFGSVESVKAASDLISPLSGEVLAVNPDMESAPEKINKDPYSAGWMLRVKPTAKLEGLLDAAAYAAFCESEAH